MKKLLHKIALWWTYYTSQRVLDAINAGKSYDEVMTIAEEELAR